LPRRPAKKRPAGNCGVFFIVRAGRIGPALSFFTITTISVIRRLNASQAAPAGFVGCPLNAIDFIFFVWRI
jgi:hypothetical protein